MLPQRYAGALCGPAREARGEFEKLQVGKMQIALVAICCNR